MQGIAGIPGFVTREVVLSVADEVLARFLAWPQNPRPERTGGYLTLLTRENQADPLVAEVGTCLDEMNERCHKLSQEKATRLMESSNFLKGHISAWQSRDREREMYGGAIIHPVSTPRGVHWIAGSFSGINEHSEEAILLAIFLSFGWMKKMGVQLVTSISDNPLSLPFLRSCRDLYWNYEREEI